MSQAAQEFARDEGALRPGPRTAHRPPGDTRRRCRCSAASATRRRSSTRRAAASKRSCAARPTAARDRPETIRRWQLLPGSRRRARAARRRTGRARAPARDREATKARILGAVGVVLARDGFGAVGVNAIAKEAGVDKVLIYRYFGGLPELLRDGARAAGSGRARRPARRRPGGASGAADAPSAMRRFFEHFIDALRERPLTLEILAAEIVERNDLTAILESEREAWGEEAAGCSRPGSSRAARPARPDAAAGRRRAVPAGAQPQDPHLRRRRPDERRRLGRAEGIDPPCRARGDPLGRRSESGS